MTTAEQLVRRAAAATPEQGLSVIRRSLALGISGGARWEAREYAAGRWPLDVGVELALTQKSAVTPMDTGDAQMPSADAAEFLSLVRSREVFGQLAGLRLVPLTRGALLQTSGAGVSWVGEGQPIPLTVLGFDRAALDPAKLAAILVISRELAEFSDPSAERLIRDDLVAATAAAASLKFLSDEAAAAGAPAGIAEGITPTASSGDILEDVMVAVSGFSSLENVALCMPVAAALLLALKAGGSLDGLPVRIVPTDAADGRIVAIDQARIAFGDGGIAIDAAEHALVQMQDAPDAFESVDADTTYVNLWQSNLVGIRSIRFLNWARGADSAVAVISGASYESAES